MRFQTGYYFRKRMVVQQDFEKGRSHCLWFRRYAIFFRVSRWGQKKGGRGAYTQYFTVLDSLYFSPGRIQSRYCP